MLVPRAFVAFGIKTKVVKSRVFVPPIIDDNKASKLFLVGRKSRNSAAVFYYGLFKLCHY